MEWPDSRGEKAFEEEKGEEGPSATIPSVVTEGPSTLSPSTASKNQENGDEGCRGVSYYILGKFHRNEWLQLIQAACATLVTNLTLHAIGGCLISALELPAEQDRARTYGYHLQVLEEARQNLTSQANVSLSRNHQDIVDQHSVSLDSANQLVNILFTNALCQAPDPTAFKWKSEGASFFTMSLFTTIGYGTFVPVTYSGRAFSMLYGTMGICTFAWFLTQMDPLIRKVECRFFALCKGQTAPRPLERLALAVLVAVCSCFVGAASVVNHTFMGPITWCEGFYFTVITLTTIGLGDIAPDVSHDHFGWPSFVWFSFWTYLGLALIGNMLAVIGEVLDGKNHEEEEENCSESKWTKHLLRSVLTKRRVIMPGIVRRVASVHPSDDDPTSATEVEDLAALRSDQRHLIGKLRSECGIVNPGDLGFLSDTEIGKLAKMIDALPWEQLLKSFS